MFYWIFPLLMINSCIQPAHLICSISLDRDLPKPNVRCLVPACLVHGDLNAKSKGSTSRSVWSAGDQCCKVWGQCELPGWDIPSLGQGKTSLACDAGVQCGVPSWGQRCVGGTDINTSVTQASVQRISRASLQRIRWDILRSWKEVLPFLQQTYL